MAELILDNIFLVLLLPLWIFLIIMCGRFFEVYVNKLVVYILTLLSSFIGIIFCLFGLLKLNNAVEKTFQFIKINNFSIPFGVHVDKLSLIIALILFIVSFVVQIFSISYMKNEPKIYKFFAFLNMFNFSMAGLLFSSNLFQMYAFWELVGVMSYLLIGFDYKNVIKSQASKRVFIINRIGDVALLTGIILTSYFMFNYAGNISFTSLNFEDLNVISTLLYAYTSTPQFYLICVLFMTGAFVKSAQFPFYTWLQDAMEAKLPVSALLHSATMVVAGVYLIIRILPFLMFDNNLMLIVAGIGLLTALICSVLASIETHPKKVLAYSTSANLGLMFLAIGMGNIKACIILLIAHAFIKAMLFLLLPQKNEISWVNYVTFLVGALTLSGLIFSGFVAKEFLFTSIKNYWSILYCIVSFVNAYYIIRLSILMIENKNLTKTTNWFEYLPSLILLLCNIVFYFYIRQKINYQIAEPFYSALAGWILAYLLYTKNKLTLFSKTPKLLENFYNQIVPVIYEKFSQICKFFDEKILSNYKLLIIGTRFGVIITNWIENNIMNRTLNSVVNTCKQIATSDLKIQTGNIQNYNAYAFILITIVICLVIMVYTLIFS